jgi:phosphatidylglycerophosphatase A
VPVELDRPGFAGQDPTRCCQALYDPNLKIHWNSTGIPFTIRLEKVMGIFDRMSAAFWEYISNVDTQLFHLFLVGILVVFLLWFSPGVLLVLIGTFLYVWYRKNKPSPPPDLDEFEHEFK